MKVIYVFADLCSKLENGCFLTSIF